MDRIQIEQSAPKFRFSSLEDPVRSLTVIFPHGEVIVAGDVREAAEAFWALVAAMRTEGGLKLLGLEGKHE